jgi:hypothetical protein
VVATAAPQQHFEIGADKRLLLKKTGGAKNNSKYKIGYFGIQHQMTDKRILASMACSHPGFAIISPYVHHRNYDQLFRHRDKSTGHNKWKNSQSCAPQYAIVVSGVNRPVYLTDSIFLNDKRSPAFIFDSFDSRNLTLIICL